MNAIMFLQKAAKNRNFKSKLPTVLLGTVHCSAVFKPFLLKEEVGRENQVNHEEKNARPTLFM